MRIGERVRVDRPKGDPCYLNGAPQPGPGTNHCSRCNGYCSQGFIYRPDRPNRRDPVPVYRSGLAENRSVPVEFKFEFKKLSSTGSYRYTGWLDRFTGRFDRFEFKSKFKIACVTGLERYTGWFDQFTKWTLMGRHIFFLFCLTLNARKVC